MANRDQTLEASLLERAAEGDADAFQQLAEPLRSELRLHCYRMVGSIHDADDLVQESLLRAWRSVARFEARTSFRRWLYKIATNACLNALESRARATRVLPDTVQPPSNEMPGAEPSMDVAWLEPYPDALLADIPDVAPAPDARYEMREAVRLAFIAAIQFLPPRQRAALLLRDVLGWSAAEVATLLDSTVPSVNAALQRARETIERRHPPHLTRPGTPPSDSQRKLLERYMASWERSDVAEFVALLREDVVFTMPPWRQWFRGRDAVRGFFSWVVRPDGRGPFRLVPTSANGQPAFAFYRRGDDQIWRAHSIQVLDLDDDSIAVMTSFVTPALFSAFGLPAVLAD